MTLELYKYQEETVAEINANGHPTYLAFEMGTGKTPIAIETAKARKVKRLLIMCPAVGKLTWMKELHRWWPGMPVRVVKNPKDLQGEGAFILSYNLVSMDNMVAVDVSRGAAFDMTVLDEAHALKNPGANRTKAVLKTMLPKLGFVLPMSGTPTPNHAGELFPILRTIFPETVRKSDGKLMKQNEFEDRYCEVVTKWFQTKWGRRPVRVIEGTKNGDVLRATIKPYFLRKTKKQVLPDLPDMTFDTFPVVASGAPDWGVGAWDGMSDAEIEALIARGDAHVMRVRHQTGMAKVPGAVEAISDMLDNCKRKVVVFAHHKDVIDRLMQDLALYGAVRLTGDTSGLDRELAIHRFLDDDRCRVFIGNIQAAGTTITLVGDSNEVSDVFFVEASYSPMDNVQAASRIHRIGQKDAVQVWFLTAFGTIDDRIQEILVRKAQDFKTLFG